MNSIIRLDTRGRLVIPNEFREILNLKEGAKDLVKMEIEFGDTPGCLAKIAEKIANLKIDLVMTESKSSQRGKKARWSIIGDISKCSYSVNEINQMLLQSGFVEFTSITKIARGGLHR